MRQRKLQEMLPMLAMSEGANLRRTSCALLMAAARTTRPFLAEKLMLSISISRIRHFNSILQCRAA